MAAVSPIVVNSSSPNAYRIQSATPPNIQRSSIKLVSSSPGLASPSTFVKPRRSGLKSGSYVQHVPDGAPRGFASGASLWKLQESEAGARGDLHDAPQAENCETKVKEGKSTSKKSSGKLVKPRKTTKVRDEADTSKRKATTNKEKEFAYCDMSNAKSKNAVEDAAAPSLDNDCDQPLQEQRPRRKSSIGLAEYAFELSKDDVRAQSPAKPAKKPRKRPTKSVEGGQGASTKKPRKQKKKSESIILNSDEPDFEIAPMSADVQYSRQLCPAVGEPPTQGQVGKETSKRKGKEVRGASARHIDADVDQTYDHEASLQRHETDGIIHVPEAMESIYFAKPQSPAPEHEVGPALPAEPSHSAGNVEPGSPVDTNKEMASRRRRSWTPAKDTTTVLPCARPHTADSESSTASYAPKVQLTEILGGFNYVSNDIEHFDPPGRSTAGEAATKRRRIELAAPVTGADNARKTSDDTPSGAKKPAKPKKAKKKAQTITALATAAYQPSKESEPDGPIISQYFASPKDSPIKVPVQAEQPQLSDAKPKKARKRRVKSVEVDVKTCVPKPKKDTKTRKTKVKLNAEHHRPKLYSPARALAQSERQDFLFGTSSQLAVDEPASFIRDMQVATKDSELMPKLAHDGTYYSMTQSSQAAVSPPRKSYTKVPTAPHGTCLSVEQADRELWCVSSRDFSGGFFRRKKQESQEVIEQETVDTPAGRAIVETISDLGGLNERHDDTERVIANPCMDLLSLPVHNVQELSVVPPAGTAQSAVDLPPYELQCKTAAVGESSPTSEANDSWNLLQSDEPEPQIGSSNLVFAGPALAVEDAAPPRIASSPPKFLSPYRYRHPLNSLDPNTIIAIAKSPEKPPISYQVRTLSSTAGPKVSSARSPADQPRRHSGNETTRTDSTIASPKRRGRPSKKPTIASDPSPQLLKGKRKDAVVPASQRVLRSEWLDIDEISDSDSAPTPSPPRRRASSSPPAVRPLELSPVGSPSVKEKAPTFKSTAHPPSKSDPLNLLRLRADLFPQITSTVKSAPHSTDPSRPSWWQKILLYDPIVLEDITAWLNEQGLQFQHRRLKAKPKKRGRKRKNAADIENEEVEWEVLQEPLQPWMVQKWCEEKSICCLWKNGLRGGVRTRY